MEQQKINAAKTKLQEALEILDDINHPDVMCASRRMASSLRELCCLESFFAEKNKK